MIRKYKVPIQGTLKKRTPLTGDANDPVIIMPFRDLDGFPTYLDTETQTQVRYLIDCTCLNYDVDEDWCEIELEADEAVHDWLANILPQLKDIQKAKGWKLDKSKMEEK